MNKTLKLVIVVLLFLMSVFLFREYGTDIKITYRKNLINTQRDFKKKISQTMIKIKKENSKEAIAILLFSSFIYGSLHAAGPGHGKVFLSSYVLTKKLKNLEIILLGSLISFFHVTSAIIIVNVLKFSMDRILPSIFSDIEKSIQVVSFTLIILMGIYLLFHEIKQNENNHHNHKTIYKNSFFMALAIGGVPCPGAMTLLIFSISLKMFKIGVLAAYIMAIGMAITIFSIGILTKLGKTQLKFSGRKTHPMLRKTLSLIGPILMILLSSLFLLALI